MAYIKNFERPETKHIRLDNGITDNNNPWDNPTVKASNDGQQELFRKNLKQWTEFISWAR